MAIVLEEKKEYNWGTLLIILAIITLVIGLAYFLFFAPVPAIESEKLKPAALQTATEFSGVEFDPATVINSDKFRSLRRFVGQSSVGKTGRENPFIKY